MGAARSTDLSAASTTLRSGVTSSKRDFRDTSRIGRSTGSPGSRMRERISGTIEGISETTEGSSRMTDESPDSRMTDESRNSRTDGSPRSGMREGSPRRREIGQRPALRRSSHVAPCRRRDSGSTLFRSTQLSDWQTRNLCLKLRTADTPSPRKKGTRVDARTARADWSPMQSIHSPPVSQGPTRTNRNPSFMRPTGPGVFMGSWREQIQSDQRSRKSDSWSLLI